LVKEIFVPSLRKIIVISAFFLVAVTASFVAKWYHTAALEEIHPKRGVYGMTGLELWIDINARMPGFAREWGCKTLRGREKIALGGQNSMPPYSCQPGFGKMANVAAYDSIVNVNLHQASAGLGAERATAIRTCFDAKIAESVTPEDIVSVNKDAASATMSRVVIAVNEAARACKAETAP